MATTKTTKKQNIEVPEFLKKKTVDPKLKKLYPELYKRGIIEPADEEIVKLNRTVKNLRSFLVNDYIKNYPEFCISFVIPNTYLEDSINDYFGLTRQEMIKKMLSRKDVYAVVHHKENNYKLLNAYEAYKISSTLLQENKRRKISIRRTGVKKVKLYTVVDLVEIYRSTPNTRFRKIK